MSWNVFSGIRMAADNARLANTNKLLYSSLQALTNDDVTTYYVTPTNKHYTGNPYPSYSSKITAIRTKYDGSADWGCGLTRMLIDTRVAFIVGGGVKARVKPEYDATLYPRELEYVKKFIQYNNINTTMFESWARNGEIEGRGLVLLYRRDDEMVRAVMVPYREKSYSVEWNEVENDPYTYTAVVFPEYKILPDRFVFVRLGGADRSPNETPPKIGLVLREVEDVDKAMWDWRKINHLYASPTPCFTADSLSMANKIWEWIKNTNWRIGKAFVTTGKFDLVGHKGDGYQSLREETEAHVKMISGVTGVPPHILGFPDLLSNRSTAETLMESVITATADEKAAWVGGFTELFNKVLQLGNMWFNKGFSTDVVEAYIPSTSAAKIEELKTVWLPLRQAGMIDLNTFLSHVPDIDLEDVEEKVKKEQEEEYARQMELLRTNSGGNGDKVAGSQNKGAVEVKK